MPNCKDFEQTILDDGKVCLRISDAFAQDSGRYECEVSNCFGSSVSSCGVAVHGKSLLRNFYSCIMFFFKLLGCVEIQICSKLFQLCYKFSVLV